MQNRYLLLGTAVIVLLIPLTVQACPLCVDALKGSELGRGFNTSILFLLLMPFALVGSIGGGLYLFIRRHSRSRLKQRNYATASSTMKGE